MKTFVIEMEDGGVMKGELYEDIAPETVANFEKLANEKFYDGLIFHFPQSHSGIHDPGRMPERKRHGRSGIHHQGRVHSQRLQKRSQARERSSLDGKSDGSELCRFTVLHYDINFASPRRSVCGIRQGDGRHDDGRQDRKHKNRLQGQAAPSSEDKEHPRRRLNG